MPRLKVQMRNTDRKVTKESNKKKKPANRRRPQSA